MCVCTYGRVSHRIETHRWMPRSLSISSKANLNQHNTRPSVRTFSSSKKSLSADSSAELPSACFFVYSGQVISRLSPWSYCSQTHAYDMMRLLTAPTTPPALSSSWGCMAASTLCCRSRDVATMDTCGTHVDTYTHVSSAPSPTKPQQQAKAICLSANAVKIQQTQHATIP